MSIEIVPRAKLGHFQNGWLDTHYHFSFADYYDPRRLGHGPLRVWNDDKIGPRSGFDPHPHKDMEIITYVHRGAITHRDSLGQEGRTAAGDVQVMSAGTGILHAEYNLEDEPTELFQIWIRPNQRGLSPRWETRRFPAEERQGKLVALASGQPTVTSALHIHQDATLYATYLGPGESLKFSLAPRRLAYLVPVDGALGLNDLLVPPRAGVAIEAEAELMLQTNNQGTSVLIADLPYLPAEERG